MENKQCAVGTQNNSLMKSIDQGVRTIKGRSDIINRRLKNRERQRRYRARKRLGLAGQPKRPFAVEEAAAVQVELQPNGNHSHNNFPTRIYCGRDWKKDARRAHVPKLQKMNGSIDHSPTLTNLPEGTCLGIAKKSETMLDMGVQPASSSLVNNQSPRIVPGRRDWKAEARRKKNE